MRRRSPTGEPSPRRMAVVAVLLVLGGGLVAGCGNDQDASDGTPATTASPSAAASAGSTGDPAGLAEMQKKVDAAESAAGAADRDAAEDADH